MACYYSEDGSATHIERIKKFIYIDNQEGSIAVNSLQCHINPFGFRVSFVHNAMSLADHDLHFHGQIR